MLTVWLGRAFGNLRVRHKLIVLHNVFFLLLGCGVYFTLIPLLDRRVAEARDRETGLIAEMLAEERPLPRLQGTALYDFREGTAEAIGLPAAIRTQLDARPGMIVRDPADGESLYRKHPGTGLYRRLRTPGAFYESLLARARWTLLGVLAVVYVLAVMLLERVIMPAYVYRPLRVFLDADRATREGDRAHELIPPAQISEDEIGQIMRSRNQTVTELHKREMDLAQALAQIEQQDRLASLGLLSASVAHELNTPISVLRGSIEKLIEKFYDRPTLDRLTRMLRVTDRLRSISESLVDFARVRQREVGDIPLRPVIDEAWSLVAIDGKASSATFRNLVDNHARVIGNTDRLGQVFVNLLRNALHAIGPSGVISVQAETTENGTLTVRVDDDGPGIAADVLPNIFEAFVSSRLDARGTGLGLTVAAGIVQQHGGTIRAENRPEGGARLEFTLPAARSATRALSAVTGN